MCELQKLLTHSSLQMTQRYALLHDDALRKASDVAGALFSVVQANGGEQADRQNVEPAEKIPPASPVNVRRKKPQGQSV